MIKVNLEVADSACTGCAACVESCPVSDANVNKPIRLAKNSQGLSVSRIDKTICINCLSCYNTCPRTKDLSSDQSGSFEEYRQQIGTCYYGYSTDGNHRYAASTAGIVTEIGSYLLDIKYVDGVIASFQNNDNTVETSIFTDSDMLKRTTGSIYRQVSPLLNIVDKIKDSKLKKFLFIGLPCHISGLKSLHSKDKFLSKNIEIFTVALFCKQTKTDAFSDHLRRILSAEQNAKIDFRGKGWPGFIQTGNGKKISFTDIRCSVLWVSYAYSPDYCLMCNDPLGLNADISVGDAWLKKFYKDNIGSSFFIANTAIGNDIILMSMKDKRIYAIEENKDDIIASQNITGITFKTSHLRERASFWGGVPESCNTSLKFSLLMTWIKINKNIVEMLANFLIINVIPAFCLKIYARIYNKIFSKLI